MNAADTTTEIANWGLLQWLGGLLTPIVTAVFAHTYSRISKNETLIRQIEQGLRDDIAATADKARTGNDELRREIHGLLQTISARLDQTVTKEDMRAMLSLALDRKI